jgi:hypothetical protein
MPTIRDSDFSDMVAVFDDWQPFSDVGNATMFVAAMGFEERSPSCFEHWCLKTVPGRTAILIRYPFNRAENLIQEQRFAEAAARGRVEIQYLDYDQRSLYGAMLTLAKAAPDSSRLVVDLSSLASFTLFPVLAAITEALPDSVLQICYSEAAYYFPKRTEWEDFQAKVKELDLYERSRLLTNNIFNHPVSKWFSSAPLTLDTTLINSQVPL